MSHKATKWPWAEEFLRSPSSGALKELADVSDSLTFLQLGSTEVVNQSLVHTASGM